MSLHFIATRSGSISNQALVADFEEQKYDLRSGHSRGKPSPSSPIPCGGESVINTTICVFQLIKDQYHICLKIAHGYAVDLIYLELLAFVLPRLFLPYRDFHGCQ